MAEFTIVTPVLNQASTIEACIQSVAIQNADVEHIIIDGGSTDGTVDIIKKNEHLLSYWCSAKDLGQSHAINKGLRKATGTFFNWLNADDELTKDALSHILSRAKPTTLAVAGQCKHISEKGEELALGTAKTWDSLEATLGNYSMGQPSLFYRTSSIRELGGLNENLHLCMDMDLWFRFLLKHGQSAVVSSHEVLSQFTVRENSKSTRLAAEMEKEKYATYHALAANLKLPICLTLFFGNYPIPSQLGYQMSAQFNHEIFLANFCWHLMILAYQDEDLELCQAYFDVVKSGNRLSKTETLLWKTRIASSQLLSK